MVRLQPIYRRNVSARNMHKKCGNCGRFEGLIITNCSQCGDYFCLNCCQFRLVCDGKFYCDKCRPASEIKYVEIIATFEIRPGSNRAYKDHLRCPWCNWLVWFKSDEKLYPHSCARAEYRLDEEGKTYRVTAFGDPRDEWEQITDEEVMAARVAARLGAPADD
jgi:hypothetical protein